MSTSNRTKVLIGFGALAIILVGAVAFWPPTFRNEEASGAIGMVQKHRAPQIAQKDVILGNEKTRTEEDMRYRDFLIDATKLQSISASLMSASASRTSIAQDINALQSQLQSRYASRMQSALQDFELSARRANNTALLAQAQQMASRVQSKEVPLSEIQELNAEFDAMQSKTASRFALQDADQDLVNAFAAMASNTQLASKELLNAQQALNDEFALSSMTLASQAQYFSRVEMEARVLQSATQQLASKEVASRLSDEAVELANTASKLESAALQDIEANLSSQTQMASALADMDGQLASRMQSHQLGAMFSREVASIQQILASRDSEFRARASADIQQELSSIQEYAASRMQYSRLANAPQLQASELASAQLQSRQLYSRLADTAELQSRLAAIEQQLSNTVLASRLSNEAQLAAQCSELQSRLASRQQ